MVIWCVVIVWCYKDICSGGKGVVGVCFEERLDVEGVFVVDFIYMVW